MTIGLYEQNVFLISIVPFVCYLFLYALCYTLDCVELAPFAYLSPAQRVEHVSFIMVLLEMFILWAVPGGVYLYKMKVTASPPLSAKAAGASEKNRTRKVCFIPFIFILLGFCIYVVYQCRESMESGLIEDMPTTGDMILFIFRGMREYVPELDPVFLIPVTWLLIQLYIAFVIGGYAYEDLGAYGQQFLLRSTIFGRFSLQLTPDIGYILSDIDVTMITEKQMVLHLVVLPMMTSLNMSFIQMLLSLWIKPTLSFVFVMSYMTISAYWATPVMIGNYSMILRFSPIVTGGIRPSTALWMEGIVFFLFVLASRVLMRRYDFIDKNE